VQVLRTDQKALVNDFVTALLPLEFADPRELRDVFRVVCGKEGGTAEAFGTPDGHAWLQVIAPAWQLPHLRAAVARLDVPWIAQARDGSASLFYRAKHRPSAEVEPFATAGDSGATVFDPALNAVLRRDETFRIRNYLRRAGWVDLPSPHAMLSLRLYEVHRRNDRVVGVDWIAWKNGPGRSLLEVMATRAERGGDAVPPVIGDSAGTLLSGNALLTSAYLDFLASTGTARVVAEPQLLVRTGVTAAWAAVDQILAFDVEPADLSVPSDQGIAPDHQRHTRALRRRVRGEIGTFLEARAVIGTESTELELTLETTTVTGTTPQGMPILGARHVTSKVRVFDGVPFVLGGLSRRETTSTEEGWWFTHDRDTDRRVDLVVVCIPHVYRGCAPAITAAPVRDLEFGDIDYHEWVIGEPK